MFDKKRRFTDGSAVRKAAGKRVHQMGFIGQKALRWGVSEKAAAVIVAAALALAAVLTVLGGVSVRFGDESFTVRATFWPGRTAAYADVDSVTWCEDDDPGDRTSGFGSLRLQLGTFRNDALGYHERYTYTGCGVSVVLTLRDDTLVLGGKDEAATRAIYEELAARCGKGQNG